MRSVHHLKSLRGYGYPRPIRLTQNVLLVVGVRRWGTIGSFSAFACARIFSKERVAQRATTGDSTRVSVLITCTVFFRCSTGSSLRASQTSCTTAVESLPPLYPHIHGIISERYNPFITSMTSLTSALDKLGIFFTVFFRNIIDHKLRHSLLRSTVCCNFSIYEDEPLPQGVLFPPINLIEPF